MRRMIWPVTVGLSAALLASAATAGGIFCMLSGRDVSYGKIASAPNGGVYRVQPISDDGARELRVSPKALVYRIQRIQPEEIRPGEFFVARPAEPNSLQRAVVFGSEMDLMDVYAAVGHGTKRVKTASKTASRK